VPSDHLQIVSKGKEAPVCQEENESCWAKNRRGHFVLTAK
jgi:peptidoglycan-associated lipoprotein